MNYIKYLIILFILITGCQSKTSDRKVIEKPKILETEKPNYLTEPIDTIINSDRHLVIGNKSALIKIIPSSDSLKYKSFRVVDFKNDILFIAKNLDKNRLEIYEKYNPKATFSDFKVEPHNGKLIEPDFDAHPWAKRYITRITEECKNGINFAGKYTLVIWGCGSPCQGGVVVDRTNGKIYDGYFSTYGSEFRPNSKLIIFNSALIDENTKLTNLHNIVEVSTKIWDGNKFKKI